MAELFSETGQSSDVGGSTPILRGVFIPGIDQATFPDGLGLTSPLGGGGSLRNYLGYGPSAEGSPDFTQLRDLSNALGSFGGGGIDVNFEGLVGPQGPPGPPGPPGLPGTGLSFGTPRNGLYELPEALSQIELLGTDVDKMIYTSAFEDFYEFVWALTPIKAGVSSWNDSDINTDDSYLIVVANAGIYISTDDGVSWTEDAPSTDDYILCSCAATGGKAIVLGDTGRGIGVIYTTTDYGVTWSDKTVIE